MPTKRRGTRSTKASSPSWLCKAVCPLGVMPCAPSACLHVPLRDDVHRAAFGVISCRPPVRHDATRCSLRHVVRSLRPRRYYRAPWALCPAPMRHRWRMPCRHLHSCLLQQPARRTTDALHAPVFVATVEAFSDPKFCIDVLKLESPIPAAHLPQPGSDGSAAAQAWFDKIGNAATVP